MESAKENKIKNIIQVGVIQSVKVIFCFLLSGCLLIGCNQGNRTKIANDKPNSEARLIVTNIDALELLIGLGAGKNVVGIGNTTTRSFLDGTQSWPGVGRFQNPNIEAIINLKPDFVVAYQRWPDSSFEDKLKPFNIPVERLNGYMANYHSEVSLLASLVGKESRADTMIHDFDRIVDMVKRTTDIYVKKKVFFEFATDFVALGVETGSNEMLELANVTNITAKLKISYPIVSTEWLLEEQPEIIIKTISSDTISVDMYEKLISRTGWDKLDAVKNNQVFLISSELCSGPRAMIGSLYIGKWCYPERFTSVNPDSIHSAWLEKYYGITTSNSKFIHTPKI